METAIFCRHAESELSALGIANGDPRVPCGLTEYGDEQARALGRALAGREIGLAVTSEFERTRRTAEIALSGRELPWLELAELNDVRVGAFEGGNLDLYREWAHAHQPEDRPPGEGESRAEVAARFAKGFHIVLERPELTILVVMHGLAISYLRETAAGSGPKAVHDAVPYARPFEFGRDELESAVERLDAWTKSPSW